MKTTQRILKAISLSYPRYAEWRDGHFINWCYDLSKKEYMNPLILMKHDGLLNWYCDMWSQHVEKQFMRDYGNDLEHLSSNEAQELLLTYPEEITAMVPTALIQMIKSKTPKKPLYESK